MANSYYSLSITAPMADLKAALINKYGSGGITVYYETASYLIVSVPAISDKVLKFAQTRMALYYGDAWSSGSTITNAVLFSGYDSSGTNATELHLVLGDNLLLLCTLESSLVSRTNIIGKMTNNKYVCIGMIGNSNSSYTVYHKGKNKIVSGLTFWCTVSSIFLKEVQLIMAKPSS